VDALIAGVIGVIAGGGVSFVANYFLNVQRYKQDTKKQKSDHDHNLAKQKTEYDYERQIFLRQKYEDLVFRLIDFSMILGSLDLNVQQQGTRQININEFIEKGGQIEVITVLYFPKLVDECKRFLDVANPLFVSQYNRHHHSTNSNSDNLESLKIQFDERYDELYSEIQKYKSDYT
jgi:hypothetical protein